MTVTPRTGSRIEELLARSGRFFIPGEISADLRTVTRRAAAATATCSIETGGATTRWSAPHTG